METLAIGLGIICFFFMIVLLLVSKALGFLDDRRPGNRQFARSSFLKVSRSVRLSKRKRNRDKDMADAA